ncbi:DNA-binding transcriptional MerR regulator [Lysinibacillus composti]|uniref:MerR family transcriptional regulator n=1 Tax=Lysinibacillus composti TaxID=720633 RepID=A0A3N9UF62_9BACI|nr:MerR family transcriptional regulator [Lysinibacillus composti]MBM7608549.1 DNA-binding transcriptional MerR regulator [Lysinibacillus composti]RQW74834.1 MerR family transcriptional regulator [Lysinibacillus composti]
MASNTYATAAVAQQVGISKQKINYYISVLEKNGYKVKRNARSHREYSDRDIEIIKALILLNKNRGVKLNEAAQLLTSPGFEVETVTNDWQPTETLTPRVVDQGKYNELANSMEILVTHVAGIEQQNTQLLELIQAQRKQNELLMEQNETLKNELGNMMSYLIEKANEPVSLSTRQLDRVEQQNNAIMNTLNRINFRQHEQQITEYEEQKKEKEKGLFSFLKK